MSAYKVPLHRIFKSVLPKHVIKTRFAIFNKVSFAVLSNLVCIAIQFKIVKLIFPHRLRLCNTICVEYRVVYSVCVLHIACTVKTQYDYRVFECTTFFKMAFSTFPNHILRGTHSTLLSHLVFLGFTFSDSSSS